MQVCGGNSRTKMGTRINEQDEEAEIHGDVLEAVLSHVPSVHLVSASYVSTGWRGAVSSSLRHLNSPKPWLLLHTQSTRPPHTTTSHAYDPRSKIWIKIHRPPIESSAALRSSAANFLYTLSPSAFTFSIDPLHSDWCTTAPPRIWRQDPVVSRVGDAVVVAGGVCSFEDDPLAVEVYDLRARDWRRCESMPLTLKDSASSQWLSAAATKEELIVVEKQTGLTHRFQPETKSWSGLSVMNPGQPVRSYHIGFSGNRLVLIGVIQIENGETVKIWRVLEDDFSFEEIGEMPRDYVDGLRNSFGDFLIEIRVAGSFVYVVNSSEAEAVVACEVKRGGGCRWWKVANVVAREEIIAKTAVFSCCEVGMGELERAVTAANWRFEVVE